MCVCEATRCFNPLIGGCLSPFWNFESHPQGPNVNFIMNVGYIMWNIVCPTIQCYGDFKANSTIKSTLEKGTYGLYTILLKKSMLDEQKAHLYVINSSHPHFMTWAS